MDGLVWSFVWSLLVSLAATVLHVFCCMLTAYPLTKKSLKGRTGILLFILFTMLFSGGLIPFYLLIQDLHLMNNPLIYILPGLVSGFDIIIAKNFLSGISDSLAESAQLDGAGEYRIFFSIYPVSYTHLFRHIRTVDLFARLQRAEKTAGPVGACLKLDAEFYVLFCRDPEAYVCLLYTSSHRFWSSDLPANTNS